MSRTPKHNKNRGPLAYGKGHKQRGCQYEFWTSRGGKCHGEPPGHWSKRMAHRRERREAKKETKE